MKKVKDYLIVGIFIMTTLLAAAVGLKVYSGYTEKKVAEEMERQNREAVIARNSEAQIRIAEMQSEIAGMAGNTENLQMFIEEAVTAANAVQERKVAETVTGNAGVSCNSCVLDNGTVSGSVMVSGGRIISDSSMISGNGSAFGYSAASNDRIISDSSSILDRMVSGDSTVSDNRMASGNATFSGNKTVSGNMTISGNGDVSGNMTVSGNGSVSGNMTVSGNGSVSGNTTVSGNGSVSGNTTVSGNGSVSGNTGLWTDIDETGMSLEEHKMFKTSYEETLEVNQADRKRIAENQYDFSQMKIACLGDSITAASNLENEEDYEQYAYPARLQELLGAEEVYNLGIGGSSIGRYWSDAFVERYSDIPEDTDIIIVMGGTNDGFCVSDDEFGNLSEREYRTFCGDLNELMSGLRERYPEAVVFFATPLPNVLQDYLMAERGYLLPQKSFVEVISTLAKEYDFELVDLYNSNILDSHDANIVTEYIPDGVHGNHEGYQILAERFASEIMKYYDGDR